MIDEKDVSKVDANLFQIAPCQYQYMNGMLNKRTVLFNDEVDADIVEMIAMPLLEFEQDDSNEPVNLIINTPGGEVFTSLFLINIIDNYKKKLNIYIYGMAMSAGIYIMSAGNKNPNVTKYCYAFSFGLLHAGSVGLEMGAQQAKDTMKFLNHLDEMIEDYLVKNTNITSDFYQNIKEKEYYMDAQEMKRLGFVDEILM